MHDSTAVVSTAQNTTNTNATPMPATNVTVMRNGPLRIEGDFQLVDPTGTTYGLGGRTIISLCRCGLSNTKPFCDGSHNHHGYKDEPAARDLPPKA